MAAESKFDKLRSMVHQGVPMEKPAEKIAPEEVNHVATIVDAVATAKTETEVKSKTVGQAV